MNGLIPDTAQKYLMLKCRNIAISGWKKTENLVTRAIYRKKEMYTRTWLRDTPVQFSNKL